MRKPSAFGNQLSAIPIAVLLCAAALSCGPSVSVKPLRLGDPSLSPNARRFLADTEDAVAITGAWRDATAVELARMREWREALTRSTEALGSDQKAKSAIAALRTFADATVLLNEKKLILADAELELARQKFVQITAEIATQHDMAVYDLEKIRKRTDEARKDFEEKRRNVEKQRRATEELNTVWLRGYASYIKGGGNPGTFWLKVE